MKADGSAPADAYAAINLVIGQPEVWVTVQVGIPASTLAAFFSPWQISLYPAIGINPDGSTMIDGVSLDPLRWITFTAPSGSLAVADTWMTVEFHHVNGGASDVYINGTLDTSGADGGSGDVQWVALGQFLGGGETPPSVDYYKTFMIGSTRGSSDLFSDDFSSGTFDAWTLTVGDVSIVPDPFGYVPIPPPVVVYSRVYGIQITLSDDGVEQVAQLVTSLDGFS